MHTFITSDHHFGSWRNLFSCFHVFSKEQEDDAIKKWNLAIGKDDLVYYLGDFHDCCLIDLVEYRKRLNGNIILVKGNHDILPNDIYKEMFDDVVDEIEVEGISLKHEPYADGRKQIYGHLHRGVSRDPFMLKNGFCACACFHDGWPLAFEDISQKLKNNV